jgi:hypothetical protein
MDRRAVLQQLSRQFAAASEQADWAALEKLSASLAKSLPLLAERGMECAGTNSPAAIAQNSRASG